MSINAHDPATEAALQLGAGRSPRVLEPSPPTVVDGPFFSDDPAALGDSDGRDVVTPTSAGAYTWDDIVAQQPELADWAAERWLANRPRLPALPAGYVEARNGYHRLAYGVVAEARRLANGKFGLRYTRGGYGTPFFGNDEQVRVENGVLVHQQAGDVRSAPITTLRAAADFLGVEPGTEAGEHDSPPLGDFDEDLNVTAATGAFLGEWYGLAWAVLEELRVTDGAVDPERTQLWPGHFDPAIAMGDADAGSRATFGVSPGDHGHDEPYLYIGAWGEVDADDPFWNANAFAGAELSVAALVAGGNELDGNEYAGALTFFREGYRRLLSS
jgi:hypothetical protein